MTTFIILFLILLTVGIYFLLTHAVILGIIVLAGAACLCAATIRS